MKKIIVIAVTVLMSVFASAQTDFIVQCYRDTNIYKDYPPVRLIVCDKNREVIDSLESHDGFFRFSNYTDSSATEFAPAFLFFRAKGSCPVIHSLTNLPNGILLLVLTLNSPSNCYNENSGVRLHNVNGEGDVKWEYVSNSQSR